MNHRPYPTYKDSGIEWLGEIPEHWEVKRLKHVAQCLDGKRIPLNSEQRGNMQGEIPYWGANGVLDYVDQWLFDEPLVLLGEDGAPFFECGKNVAFFVNEKVWVNNHAHVLRANGIESIVLAYILNTVEYRSFIDGSTRDKLTQGDMIAIPIQVPPLPEQQAIAAFLDRETARIDGLIEKKQRQIELLQEKRAALISHAVTKGLNPNAKMKDSGIEWLGEIPEHWAQKSVKYMTQILRGKFTHRPRNDPRMYDGPYPFIQTGDVAAAGKFIQSYHQTLSEDGYSVSKMFPKGTLVMTIAANIGDMAVLDFEACFPDSIVGFVPSHEVILNYLYYLFIGMKQALMSTATLNTQLNLNIDRIGSVVAPHPTIDEQHAIVDFLDRETARIDGLIKKVEESMTLLREYRTALISAAVTGKIDVRGEDT